MCCSWELEPGNYKSFGNIMSTTQNHLKTFLQVLSKKLRSERPEEERDAVKIVAVDLQVRW